MANRYIDITGIRFGKLIALHPDPINYNPKKERWIFKCDCGKEKSILKGGVTKKTKPTKTCGCILSKEEILNKYTHIKENGCLEWTGYKDKKGYGQAHHYYKRLFAHRLSWMVHKGEIPEGMLVCHTCDNPPCCNPDHLFLGTYKENIQDMIRKGRSNTPKGERVRSSKLKNSDIYEIKKLFEKGYSMQEISNIYMCARSTISNIINRKTWKHI